MNNRGQENILNVKNIQLEIKDDAFWNYYNSWVANNPDLQKRKISYTSWYKNLKVNGVKTDNE